MIDTRSWRYSFMKCLFRKTIFAFVIDTRHGTKRALCTIVNYAPGRLAWRWQRHNQVRRTPSCRAVSVCGQFCVSRSTFAFSTAANCLELRVYLQWQIVPFRQILDQPAAEFWTCTLQKFFKKPTKRKIFTSSHINVSLNSLHVESRWCTDRDECERKA